MNVQPSTIAELEAAPNIEALLAEYAAESAIDGLPPPAAKVETYRTLEAARMLHTFSALTSSGQLAGYITVLAPELPHYSAVVAVAESFFVAKRWRMTGAGVDLLHAAEDKARALGSPGLLVSAPYAGRLFDVLPRLGYVETSRIFFKRVAADE